MPVVALVAVAAVAASAAIKGDAARKAANARKDAINAMENISPSKEQDLALSRDQQHIRDQLQLQKDADPVTAAIREKGLQGYLDSLSGDTAAEKTTDKALAAMSDETLNADPRVTAIKDKLLADAKAELDQGAKLSPDFQAEVVRAGLTSAGQAGWDPSSKGYAGRHAGEMLGSAGLALQQQRKANATQAATLATDLTTARSNILSRLIGTAGTVQQARDQKAAAGISMAQQMMPAAGLSGREMVNLDMARINQQNKKALGLGEVNAAKATAKGEELAGYTSAAASGATAMYNWAGGGNLFGSLFNSAPTVNSGPAAPSAFSDGGFNNGWNK